MDYKITDNYSILSAEENINEFISQTRTPLKF